MSSRLRRTALTLVLAAALGGGPAARTARPEDPPPAPPSGGVQPLDPAAEEKKKRIELEQRKRDLPPSARAAIETLERFRSKDFRVWGTLRAEIVTQGANALPAIAIGLDETDWETRAFAASCLGDIRDKSVVGSLSDAYGKEKYGEARRQMVLALAALEAESAQAPLVKALADE